MQDMTESNLLSAFSGESMAHMRYQIWGKEAEVEDYLNVARLFAAISYAEEVHAINHFGELRELDGDRLVPAKGVFGLGSTEQNLQGAIDGESYEISQMYPVFLRVAEQQGEDGAIESFHWALSAERTHVQLFSDAQKAVSREEDMDLGPVQVCNVCGYTIEGEAPEECPICQRGSEVFETFA